MLNTNRVLNYIKDNLGFPFMQLELEDDKIIEYFQTYSLKEFSYYVPEVKRIGLNLDAASSKVPGRANEYYIEDPQGREILNVVDVYFSGSDLMFFGHPPIGAMSHYELRQWSLDVATSMDTKMFSSFDYTSEFIHPNMIRISPTPNNGGNCVLEYERMQSDDLSGISNEFHWIFQQLCLADIMIVLGRIRTKYGSGNLRTVFGEIPLDAEVLNDGKEMKREVLEKLNMGPLLNIIFDRG